MEGGILVHFTPKGETVKSHNYCDALRTKLKPVIRPERLGKLRKDFILLHENTRPYTASQTVKAVNEMGFELMEHPSGLDPRDFHMFDPMKEDQRGRRFSSDEEVTGTVQNWLKMQPKAFLTELKNCEMLETVR
jgi:hypothetical protein